MTQTYFIDLKCPICGTKQRYFVTKKDLHKVKSPQESKWWELLDWSTMESTFNQISDTQLKAKILDEGYWSKGKGRFIADEKREK